MSENSFDAILDIVYAPTYPADVAAVLDAAGPALKRYVFTSSSTVYKNKGVYPIREDDPREGNQLDGGYTQHKFDCENLLFERFERAGAPITIIRPRHIYGPRNYSYREGFHFDRLLRNRPILIPGDGSLLTQNGYVDDVADAFRLVIECDEAVGQAYTITGRECVTVDAYIDLLGQVTATKPKKVYFDPALLSRFESPGPVFGQNERFDEGHACFDLSKAKDQLGYVPQFSLEEGLRLAFAFHNSSADTAYYNRVLDFAFEDAVIELASKHN